MTNRERVFATIQFQPTDYLPHHVDFTGQMYRKMAAFRNDPNFLKTINNHLLLHNLNKPQIELKPGFFQDEFGVVWNKTGVDKDIGVIDNICLKDHEDLETFALAPVDEGYIRGRMEALSKNESEFRMAGVGFSLFERAWTLRGMEDLLCDMIIAPEFVDELLDRITDRLLKIIDIALEYEFDGFYFGDDWGQQKGLIMGPNLWRRFIKPRLAKLYGRVREGGKYVIQHSCGDIREVMDDLIEIGLNVYNTFQPEIYGYEYADKIYGKLAIWGGISTQRDLPSKTPEEIKSVTREILHAFRRGGLIAGPTHAVPGDVPPENLEAMLSVLQRQ